MTIKFHTGREGRGGGVNKLSSLGGFLKALCHAICYLFKKLKRVFTPIEFKKNYDPFLLFMGASGSGSVIRDHSDHDASKAPVDPLLKRIHQIISSRFLSPRPPLLLSTPNQNRHATQARFTMIRVISDH